MNSKENLNFEETEKFKLENPLEKKPCYNTMVSDYSAAIKKNNNHLENNLIYLKNLLNARLEINEILTCSLIKMQNYTNYQMNM